MCCLFVMLILCCFSVNHNYNNKFKVLISIKTTHSSAILEKIAISKTHHSELSRLVVFLSFLVFRGSCSYNSFFYTKKTVYVGSVIYVWWPIAAIKLFEMVKPKVKMKLKIKCNSNQK